MNFASYLLVGLVAVWLVAAIVHIVRHRGGCCGGGCDGKCESCGACGCKCARERRRGGNSD